MISESEKFQEEDRKLKDRIDAKNEFESYVYSLKGNFDKIKSKLSVLRQINSYKKSNNQRPNRKANFGSVLEKRKILRFYKSDFLSLIYTHGFLEKFSDFKFKN